MAQRDWALFTITPRSVSLVAVLFFLLAAVFGLLKGQKPTALHTTAAPSDASASALPRADSRTQKGKASNAEDRAAKAEAALAQAEKDKAVLQNKLDILLKKVGKKKEKKKKEKERKIEEGGGRVWYLHAENFVHERMRFVKK